MRVRKWKNLISNLCLIAGIAIIASVVIKKEIVQTKQASYLDNYYKKEAVVKNNSDLLPDTFQILGQEEGSKSYEEAQTIGILSIPKIGIETAVLEGVNKETLRYSVGHYEGTPLPKTGGNFCVVGHRSYSYGEFFNRLDEMEIGDEIYFDSEGENYTFKIFEIVVVNPEDIWVLDNTDNTIITLITCTPIRVGTHRLIVRGILE